MKISNISRPKLVVIPQVSNFVSEKKIWLMIISILALGFNNLLGKVQGISANGNREKMVGKTEVIQKPTAVGNGNWSTANRECVNYNLAGADIALKITFEILEIRK